jgi:hypothetical protein
MELKYKFNGYNFLFLRQLSWIWTTGWLDADRLSSTVQQVFSRQM